MKPEIKNLRNRIERIGGTDDWVPFWLADVASEAEVEEWRSINQIKGFDRDAPVTAFIQRMRAKYPNMAKGYEEQVAEEVAKLEADPELRKREDPET